MGWVYNVARSTLARMAQETHSIRFPADVWTAIELTAQREEISAAEVVRIGALSYAAFCLARAGDEASEAMAALFAQARETFKEWPL